MGDKGSGGQRGGSCWGASERLWEGCYSAGPTRKPGAGRLPGMESEQGPWARHSCDLVPGVSEGWSTKGQDTTHRWPLQSRMSKPDPGTLRGVLDSPGVLTWGSVTRATREKHLGPRWQWGQQEAGVGGPGTPADPSPPWTFHGGMDRGRGSPSPAPSPGLQGGLLAGWEPGRGQRDRSYLLGTWWRLRIRLTPL